MSNTTDHDADYELQPILPGGVPIRREGDVLECKKCGVEFEHIPLDVNDTDPPECPDCGARGDDLVVVDHITMIDVTDADLDNVLRGYEPVPDEDGPGDGVVRLG